MTNLVDFDMLFGHRRDPAGYGTALAEFDALLPVLQKSRPADLVIITADHGNDPTWTGTDHTREQVPLLVLPRAKSPAPRHPRNLRRHRPPSPSHLGIPPLGTGTSWL